MGKVIEHNVETGEITERDQTPEEIRQAELDSDFAIAKAKAKLDTQIKRKAILEKLGLTEEEARLLLG